MNSDSSVQKDGAVTLILRWAPALLIMAVIFLLSSTPGQDLPSFGIVDLLVKKGGHFTGYALLGLAFLRGLGMRRKRDVWIALLMVLLYAASDELHQNYTAGRHPSPLDVCIDLSGAALAAWLALRFYAVRRLVLAGRLSPKER